MNGQKIGRRVYYTDGVNVAMACSKCGEIKGLHLFVKDSTRPQGLRTECLACKRAKSVKWNSDNADYLKSYRAENVEKVREYNARYYAENVNKERERKARWRAENPEKARAQVARYAAQNPDKVRAKVSRRRARKVEASIAEFSADDLRASWEERDLWACYWCGGPLEDGFHADHVIPLARGGEHSLRNLVPSCAPCNLSKHAKLPFEEWTPPAALAL